MRSTNPMRSKKHTISAPRASLAPHRNKNTPSERFLTHFDPLHSSLRRLVNAFLCPFGNSGRVRKEDRQVKRNMPGILPIFWLEVGNVQWMPFHIHLEVFVGIPLPPSLRESDLKNLCCSLAIRLSWCMCLLLESILAMSKKLSP